MYIVWNVQEAENVGILASLKISHFPFWFPTLKGSIREREGNGKNPFPKFGNGKGMKKSIPKIREREGNEKNPFPKFGNGKGMKKIHSRNSGTGREWKKFIPEIREREGNKKIHSRNSGKGIRGIHSWECPGTGIPAHPWCIETCYICLECILNLYCINFIENLYSRKVLLEKQNLPPIWLFLLVLRMATYSGETSLSWLHSDFIVMR